LGVGIAAYVVFMRANPKAYFPLREGLSYRFQVDNEGISAYKGNGTIHWQMLHVRELTGGKVLKVTPRRTTRGDQRPAIDFLTEDSSGISVVGHQFGDEGEVKMADKPTYLIKYPIRLGTTWDEIALDLDASPNQRRVVDLKARIESTNELVTVPAGTFARCLKVKSVGSTDRISVQRFKWYAPGVGMIKFSEYRELLDRSAPSQQMTMQLQEFR